MAERRPGKPTLGASRNESLRALVRALLVRDYDSNQADLAKALGVTRSTLNGFVNGTSGAGTSLVDGLVALTGRPLDALVAAGGDLSALRETRATIEVTFGDLPHWETLLVSARALAPEVPEWSWRDLAAAQVWLTTPVTAALVADLARIVSRHVPPHA